MPIKKILYIIFGCIGVGLGAVGRIVLGIVWLFHIIYFTFVVKNYRKETCSERY